MYRWVNRRSQIAKANFKTKNTDFDHGREYTPFLEWLYRRVFLTWFVWLLKTSYKKNNASERSELAKDAFGNLQKRISDIWILTALFKVGVITIVKSWKRLFHAIVLYVKMEDDLQPFSARHPLSSPFVYVLFSDRSGRVYSSEWSCFLRVVLMIDFDMEEWSVKK